MQLTWREQRTIDERAARRRQRITQVQEALTAFGMYAVIYLVLVLGGGN